MATSYGELRETILNKTISEGMVKLPKKPESLNLLNVFDNIVIKYKKDSEAKLTPCYWRWYNDDKKYIIVSTLGFIEESHQFRYGKHNSSTITFTLEKIEAIYITTTAYDRITKYIKKNKTYTKGESIVLLIGDEKAKAIEKKTIRKIAKKKATLTKKNISKKSTEKDMSFLHKFLEEN